MTGSGTQNQKMRQSQLAQICVVEAQDSGKFILSFFFRQIHADWRSRFNSVYTDYMHYELHYLVFMLFSSIYVLKLRWQLRHSIEAPLTVTYMGLWGRHIIVDMSRLPRSLHTLSDVFMSIFTYCISITCRSLDLKLKSRSLWRSSSTFNSTCFQKSMWMVTPLILFSSISRKIWREH